MAPVTGEVDCRSGTEASAASCRHQSGPPPLASDDATDNAFCQQICLAVDPSWTATEWTNLFQTCLKTYRRASATCFGGLIARFLGLPDLNF
jgi:hypothetical protein